MSFKKTLFIVLFLVSFSNTKAQTFELGKVSIAELEEKEHPKDPSAPAVMLFKTCRVYFEDLTTITKVKTKIKIYKKEGYKWANEEILHYLNGETVSFSDAITYNLVDGKIEKTKLKSEGEFEQKINKYYSKKKIAMPNVREGSIIEYEYTVRSGNFGSLRHWYFQYSIPVNFSEYNVKIPYFLTFNKRTKGFIYPKLSSVPTYNRETSEVYKLENIPAINEESFVNNINNYRASISYELALVNIPGSIFKSFSTDWEAVTKTIYDYDDFGGELNKTGYFEEDVNKLISGLNSREEKIDAIFNFVKTSVKWNSFENYYCNDGVRKAYKDKTGNVAEINLMLTAMLRFAGFDANPVLVSTRDNGIALFPSRTAFNYVIAAVETPEGQILLDATEKYSLLNILPLRDLNWFGRLIRKDGTSIGVDLRPKTLSKEIINTSFVINSNGVITGKIRKQLTNQEALSFRQKNIITSKDTYLEDLENKNNGIEISGYVRENDLDLSNPILETYTFKDSKDFESINGKIYIAPLLFLSTKVNPFKQETRAYPVDFGFPIENKYNIMIEIPEGYAVESLPVSMNIATPDNIGTYKYVIGSTGNKIQISITSDINTAIVPADYYTVLKEFFQKMIDKQNEKIVLKKV
jgi:hypothetical protein